MEPFTFGVVATGVFGFSLVVLGLLGDEVSINDTAVTVVMETIKAGAILYLFKVLYIAFLL